MKFPKLREFIKDPSCVDKKAYARNWIKHQEYEHRWETFIEDPELKLQLKYFIENELSYYIHILVPSDKKGNTYDVVIHFFSEEESLVQDSTLLNYKIRIFSNNPVFGFHFGYANYTSGLMIDFLAPLFPRDILENKAEKYNPYSAVGYDNSFYFAGKYLLSESRFLNKTWIEQRAMKFTEKRILSITRPMDKTIEEYKKNFNRIKMLSKFKNKDRLKDKLSDSIDNAKGKINQVKDKVSDFLRTHSSKDSHRKTKITAKKSIGSKSGVRRIKARKK